MSCKGFVVLPAIVVLTLSLAWGVPYPLSPSDPAISKAITYMENHQNPDGGFGQLQESDLSTTRWVVEALASAGLNPVEITTGGKGPVDYFTSVAASVYRGETTNPLAARINLLLGLSACGIDARNFTGLDFVQSLLSMQNASTGGFGSGASDTAYSILALLSAGVPVEDPALQRAEEYLKKTQLPEGGFEYSQGFGPDSNTLSVAIIALKRMQVSDGHLASAIRALGSFRNSTMGGFFYQSMWGTTPDVSSTSLAVQAIVASGGNPTLAPWGSDGSNPIDYLLTTQNATTGEFYDRFGSLRPTSMAVPALLGRLTPGVAIRESTLTVMVAFVVILAGVSVSRE